MKTSDEPGSDSALSGPTLNRPTLNRPAKGAEVVYVLSRTNVNVNEMSVNGGGMIKLRERRIPVSTGPEKTIPITQSPLENTNLRRVVSGARARAA